MTTSIAFAGTLYPDKTFTLGATPKKRVSKEDRQYEHDLEQQLEWDANAKIDWLTGRVSVGGTFVSKDESPLFINGSKLSPTKRGKYGKHGITKFGRKFLRCTSILFQRKYTKSRLGFLTATLPRMDARVCRGIISYWGDISRRFYQKLRRICSSRGQKFIYIGCTEIQEKRFKASSLPVPHLHAVYVSKGAASNGYIFSTKECYEAWNNSVNEVLVLHGYEPIMGTGGHIGSVKLEPVRKSAASYIGKYISKGCAAVEAMKDKGYDEFPKQWWTACKEAKKMFKDSLVRLSEEECKAFFYNYEHYLHEGWFVRVGVVTIEINGEDRVIGLYGEMSDFMFDKFYNSW